MSAVLTIATYAHSQSFEGGGGGWGGGGGGWGLLQRHMADIAAPEPKCVKD